MRRRRFGWWAPCGLLILATVLAGCPVPLTPKHIPEGTPAVASAAPSGEAPAAPVSR